LLHVNCNIEENLYHLKKGGVVVLNVTFNNISVIVLFSLVRRLYLGAGGKYPEIF
jgi:hypothetical protein